MARYQFSVKRGDKLETSIGTIRFFTKAEIVFCSNGKRPKLIEGKKKPLDKRIKPSK